MNSTKSFSNRNTIVSYFTGIGLFVTTVAIYQYIQIYHAEEEEESGSKKFNNNNNDDDVDAADKEEEQRKDALRKAFERRQLSRRLSFDQFEDTDTEEVLLIQEAEKHRFWNGQMDCDSTFRQRQRGSSRSNNNNNNAHSSNEHPYPPPRRHHHHRRHREQQQQQQRRRHQPLETADNDRYHDFHPNYQNWCHFEKDNEDDNKAAKKKRRKQAQQQQPRRQPKIIQHNRHQQQSQDAGEKQQESPAAAEIDHQVYSLSEAAAANDVVNEKTTNCEESRQKSVTTRKVSLYDLEKSKQMRRRQRQQQQQQVDYISDDNNSIVTFASSYDDDHCNDHCNNHDNDVDRITSTRTNIITSNNISLQICSNYQPNTTNKSSNHRQLIHRDITTSGNSRRRRGSNNSSISSKSCRNSNNSSTYRRTTDGTEGRFQRFCRMLSGDDDIGSSGSKEEDNISISGENHNTTIFSSLNSTSGISFSNNDADTEDDDDDDDDDAETLHRALRAEYNARIIPEKLVLIRHGQSAGNVNEALYATTPDNAMPITELGWNQAKKAGIILKEKIINSGETVHFIVSPYVRTVETFHGIVSAWYVD